MSSQIPAAMAVMVILGAVIGGLAGLMIGIPVALSAESPVWVLGTGTAGLMIGAVVTWRVELRYRREDDDGRA